MKQLDASTLVAYVDGELDTESATLVEQHLADDVEAARTVELLRESASLIRAAHNHVIYETVPEHLVDTVLMAVEAETGTGDAVPEHLVNMILNAPESDLVPMATTATPDGDRDSGARAISVARRRSVAALAIAATFAAFMLGGGFLLGQYQSGVLQQVAQGQQVKVVAAMDDPWREAAFQEALEKKKSEMAVVWTNPNTGFSGAVIPVKTYQREDGTFCRAFRMVQTNSGPKQPDYGVACREPGPQGRWIKKVEAVSGTGGVPKLNF